MTEPSKTPRTEFAGMNATAWREAFLREYEVPQHQVRELGTALLNEIDRLRDSLSEGSSKIEALELERDALKTRVLDALRERDTAQELQRIAQSQLQYDKAAILKRYEAEKRVRELEPYAEQSRREAVGYLAGVALGAISYAVNSGNHTEAMQRVTDAQESLLGPKPESEIVSDSGTPLNRCDECDGVGFIETADTQFDCPKCKGNGKPVLAVGNLDYAAALKLIACYNADAPYCIGWKNAARTMQHIACHFLGVAKGFDLPDYERAQQTLALVSEEDATALDPVLSQGNRVTEEVHHVDGVGEIRVREVKSSRLTIRIDRTDFDVLDALYIPKGFSELPPTPTATGDDLIRLGGCGTCGITLLGDKWADNRDVGLNEAVPLKHGMHFITVPPATYYGRSID